VPGRSVISIDPAVTGWRTVFGDVPWDTHDLSGLCVEDLIFDGQSAANPTGPVNAASQRYAINANYGTDLRVRNCLFRNWDGRNIINLISNVVDHTKDVDHIRVEGCVFDNIGGAYWHDHSAVYVSGRNVHVHHNDFTGVATAASSAWTAIEAHGHRVDVHDNTVANYGCPCLITAAEWAEVGPASQYLYHDNVAYNSSVGVTIRPLADMAGIDVHDNLWQIGIDQWPTAAAAPYPGVDTRAGVLMYGQATGLARVRIHHNTCTWLPYTGAASPFDTFVTWRRANRIAGTDVDAYVSITDNVVDGPPSAGVHVENFASLVGWDVSRNQFRNVGRAKLGAAYQAGLMLGYQAWTGARPVGVVDLRFVDNQFVDDQATHSLSAPLLSPAGTVRVDPGCSTNGTTTVVDPAALVTDIGSLITGPNIPAGATVTQITNSPDGYTADGYLISAAATGTGTGLSMTITKQPPTFANVEARATNLRIADGGAVPLYTLQAGQVVASSAPPVVVVKAADQTVSDNTTLVDCTDLAFPVAAGGVYVFEFELVVITSVATNGIVLAINGPAAPAYLRFQALSAVSGSAINAGGVSAYNAVVAMTAAQTVSFIPNRVVGQFAAGAVGGVLALRIRSEDPAAITVQRGSWGRLTRIA
jgi:hypothetical protein